MVGVQPAGARAEVIASSTLATSPASGAAARAGGPAGRRGGAGAAMIISSMESGAPGTKSRTCLHIDLWTRSAVYFQALDKQ